MDLPGPLGFPHFPTEGALQSLTFTREQTSFEGGPQSGLGVSIIWKICGSILEKQWLQWVKVVP